jgi:hypothetical protein
LGQRIKARRLTKTQIVTLPGIRKKEISSVKIQSELKKEALKGDAMISTAQM